MGAELSLLDLVLQASLMVQLVLLVLVLASVLSWAAIFERSRVLKRARDAADDFEGRFWSGGDLSALYRELGQEEQRGLTGLAAIFRNGFREYARLRKNDPDDTMAVIMGAERSMRVALSREMDRLENNLPFLATVGSVSPYVGLFGTVWGIMHAFHGKRIGDREKNRGQTTFFLLYQLAHSSKTWSVPFFPQWRPYPLGAALCHRLLSEVMQPALQRSGNTPSTPVRPVLHPRPADA